MIGRMNALPEFPTESGPVLISGPAGRLELMVDLPEDGQERAGVAVICHPNPPDGGTLHNKVVTMTARALSELGIAAVRLNFRGVGQSEGTFDEGRGETLDLLAVTDWLKKVRPGRARPLQPLRGGGRFLRTPFLIAPRRSISRRWKKCPVSGIFTSVGLSFSESIHA